MNIKVIGPGCRSSRRGQRPGRDNGHGVACCSTKNVSEAQLRQAIGQLSTETRETWLLRLAQGEPQLSVAFNRELLKLMEPPQQASLSRRTIGDLFAAADRLQKEAQAKRAAEARARHLKKMETLAA